MKDCYKWMAACVVIALAVAFVLPRIGVPLVGVSLLAPLLMVGCCVLPMLFMMKAGKKGSCCSKESKVAVTGTGADKSTKSDAGCCH